MLDLSTVTEQLAEITISELSQPFVNYLNGVELDGASLILKTRIPLADQSELIDDIAQRLGQPVKLEADIESAPVQAQLESLAGVKNTIVVASGKGGVGKSTTAVNLALALQAQGAKVGILDADIYGPSIQLMLGVDENVRPDHKDGKFFVPVEAHGLQSMSMAYLVTDKTPMVWRGPMASGALQQMLKQTLWDDLDYLVIDMPPGTGDIQLTLSQQLPVTGSVIVTTPQNVALLDAQKGIEMFRKVGVPVFGVVENMSYHKCTNCGHEDAIFGAGAGESLAADYESPLLGRLALVTTIREQADQGKPTVVAAPDSDEASAYKQISLRLAASVLNSVSQAAAAPSIEISDE